MSQSSEYWMDRMQEEADVHEREQDKLRARITELEEALAATEEKLTHTQTALSKAVTELVEANEYATKLGNAARELRKGLIMFANTLPE